MELDLDSIGSRTEPHPVDWDSEDALLYALGVGAGSGDTAAELAFTTENSAGVEQQVLPTFAVVLGWDAPRPAFGTVDTSQLVHAEQSLVLHQPLPVAGKGFIIRSIDEIYDKGSGALVRTGSTLVDDTGEPLVELQGGAFIRGAGGFGGERGPTTTWAAPARGADLVVHQPTLDIQALLYRLSGDRNPLHSDPAFARRGGWDRPILHGLCTFGFVGRALLHGAAGSDPARFRAMSARFSAPVLPGDTLTTSIWVEGSDVLFQTHVGERLVLAHGTAEVAS
ncbi:MaoC family dehydratase [Nocardioides sp.]|uniref:MaoC family dehydratase n=1 Tax=Nocardioides sp. TaxID=35761 RepID=UPI00273538AE|nr:MaoC family dehydratase [Nocardioides sp.]MDP3893357.1 MaoC/PaaZ C-terminal domain-containing protein [Nocardioides sp.]